MLASQIQSPVQLVVLKIVQYNVKMTSKTRGGTAFNAKLKVKSIEEYNRRTRAFWSFFWAYNRKTHNGTLYSTSSSHRKKKVRGG